MTPLNSTRQKKCTSFRNSKIFCVTSPHPIATILFIVKLRSSATFSKNAQMCKPQFSTSTKPQQVGGLLTPPLPQPVTILGCTMHKHVCKQYIFRLCNTSTFNAIRFDENPLTCQCKKRKQKGLKVSNIVLLLVVFK